MDKVTIHLDDWELGILQRLLLDDIGRAKTPAERKGRAEELGLLLRLETVKAAKHDLPALLPQLPAWAIEALWTAHGAARRLPYVEADRDKAVKEVRSLKGKLSQVKPKGGFPKKPLLKDTPKPGKAGGKAAKPGASPAPAPAEPPLVPAAAVPSRTMGALDPHMPGDHEPAGVTAMDEEGSGSDAGSR